MIAVSAGHEDVVAYLLEAGLSVDVNIINSTGQNCLHYAASKNRLSVNFLLFINDLFHQAFSL